MKLLQRFNPFYWRKLYLVLLREYNLLIEEKRKSDDVAWNNELKANDFECKNKTLTEQVSQLQEELDDYINVAKNLQRQLNQAEHRNRQWFKLVLDYAPDDFTLLNKALWGQRIELVPEPCGLKDEKTDNNNA